MNPRSDPTTWRSLQVANLIRQQIAELLRNNPELEEDEQLRSDMVEGTTDAFELLTTIEMKRREAEKMCDAIDDLTSSLRLRQMRFQRREENMRKLMFQIMETAKIQKAELAPATLSIRNSTPHVIITDESLLGDQYWRIKREPDKTKLKLDLLDDITVPGAELSNAEPILAIRTK
jgi:hypothetical protein